MKMNYALKSLINRFAHAEGIQHELNVKQVLVENALKYIEEGKTIDEISELLGFPESHK